LTRPFLAINRQRLELESSSSSGWRFMAKKPRANLLGCSKSSWFDLKKKIYLGEEFAWERLAKWGVLGFLTKFDGPWTPILRAKILTRSFFGNQMISRVDRALA